GNCGAFDSSGLTASPARAPVGNRPVCAINDANPSEPIPMPHLQRKSRRVRNASSRRGWWCDIVGFIYHNFRCKETEIKERERGSVLGASRQFTTGQAVSENFRFEVHGASKKEGSEMTRRKYSTLPPTSSQWRGDTAATTQIQPRPGRKGNR